jgi:hypothetical protein
MKKRASLARRALPTIASVLAITGGVAALNEDIRNYAVRMFNGGAAREITSIEWQVRDAGWFLVHTVKDQSFEHGPLMVFAISAGVLVLFMLRT